MVSQLLLCCQGSGVDSQNIEQYQTWQLHRISNKIQKIQRESKDWTEKNKMESFDGKNQSYGIVWGPYAPNIPVDTTAHE